MGMGIIIVGIIIIIAIIVLGIIILQDNQANVNAYAQCTGSFLYKLGLQKCTSPLS